MLENIKEKHNIAYRSSLIEEKTINNIILTILEYNQDGSFTRLRCSFSRS